MLKKIVVFLCLFSCFQFLVFSATTTRSGSGSVPEMKFESWQVGRSEVVGTDPTNIVHISFITSTQEECHFTASVGYDGNQGDNVSPGEGERIVLGLAEDILRN